MTNQNELMPPMPHVHILHRCTPIARSLPSIQPQWSWSLKRPGRRDTQGLDLWLRAWVNDPDQNGVKKPWHPGFHSKIAGSGFWIITQKTTEDLLGFDPSPIVPDLGTAMGEVYMPCLCLTKKRYGGLAYAGTLSDAGRMGVKGSTSGLPRLQMSDGC